MTVLRVRGRALPDGELVDLYADGDRWTSDPVKNAALVAEGWLVPGLVDAHTHPGTLEAGGAFDEKVLRGHLLDHRDSGVTLLRSPGLAGEPPEWFGSDPELPRAVHAGPLGLLSMVNSLTVGGGAPTTPTCRQWLRPRRR
jgi:imidazolonepropionase-like amidohydrolase